jgi:hypothetical protein
MAQQSALDALVARMDAQDRVLASLAESIATLAVHVAALASAPTSAPARAASQSAAKEPRVDTCVCGARFTYGRTAADIASAGALGLCGAKGRTSHRNAQ